jgi:hypothetical protein
MLWQEKHVEGCGGKWRNRRFSPLFAIGTPLVLFGLQRRRADRISKEEEMVDMSKLGQTILATVGAMILTATAVGAAVGPARAIETAPISLVAASVSGQAQA